MNYWLDRKKRREETEHFKTIYVSVWNFENYLGEQIKLSLSDTICSEQVIISDFALPPLTTELPPWNTETYNSLDLGPYDAPEVEKGWELDL